MTNLNAIGTNYRDIGDTTLEVFVSEFTRVNSPMLVEAEATFNAARPHSALFLAQAWLENKYKTTGHIIKPEHHNPVSIRPERIGELGPYGYGLITAPDGGQFLVFKTDADCAREWKRRLFDDATYKNGIYAATKTLGQMLAVYAPSGDTHPVTGLDNADIGYASTVTTMLKQFAAQEGDVPTAIEKVSTPMTSPTFILSMGHANSNRGGATRELEWTRIITPKLKAEIIRRGGRAYIIQEEDGDTNPTDSVGRGLQNVAYLCVDLAKAVGGAKAYISMHYGGEPHRGFFGIYPDAREGSDEGKNNPLDINLCRVIAKHVEKTGMPKRTGGVMEPGVMSERQTGVGAQGLRLGEFVGTMGFRQTTARVILEGGNYNTLADREMLWSNAWQAKYVSAICDGLEEVYGVFAPDGAKPSPTPEPTPEYEKASPVPALADNRPFLLTTGGAIFVRADVIVETIRDTPRLKYAGGTAKVGPDVKSGEQFATDYLIINDDKSLYWYTPWATRIRYEDTKIVKAETESGIDVD